MKRRRKELEDSVSETQAVLERLNKDLAKVQIELAYKLQLGSPSSSTLGIATEQTAQATKAVIETDTTAKEKKTAEPEAAQKQRFPTAPWASSSSRTPKAPWKK